jgi:hypothetical protein
MSTIYDLKKTQKAATQLATSKNKRSRVFHYSTEKAHRIGGGFYVRRRRK